MSGQYHYSNYDHYGPDNSGVGQRLADHFIGLLGTLDGVRKVCDLGCGTGYLAGRMLERGYEVVGVDASDSGVAIARAAHGARAEFVCAPIDATLPARLGLGRFDAVVSSDVIEHLYRPRLLVQCARELLAPGGALVLGTPFHGYFKDLALGLLGRWDAHHEPNSDGGHIKFFSEPTLGRLLRDEGFAEQRFHRFGRVPPLWKHMICVARARARRGRA